VRFAKLAAFDQQARRAARDNAEMAGLKHQGPTSGMMMRAQLICAIRCWPSDGANACAVTEQACRRAHEQAGLACADQDGEEGEAVDH
jgi:hypothetical protein